MTRLQGLGARAIENFALDVRFLRSARLPLTRRLVFLVAKYWAMATGAQSIGWFGRRLHYDNRFTPALLQSYPGELQTVIDAAGLTGSASVLDVGANVGQFAATTRGLLPGAQVWSFEPNPTVCALLERNARDDARWSVLPYGVSATDAEVDLWFVEGKSSQGSVFEGNAVVGLLGDQHAVKVPIALRELTAQRLAEAGIPAHVDLLKIDVEGAERDALHGLRAVGWDHLLIELSAEREGQMTLADLQSEIEQIWGWPADVLTVVADHEVAQELLLRSRAPRRG
jgi:FkbM family methyltransferase